MMIFWESDFQDDFYLGLKKRSRRRNVYSIFLLIYVLQIDQTPHSQLLPVLQHIKTSYTLWYQYYQILPKAHRYSLGEKIDNLFIEIIESISVASFLTKGEKIPYVRIAIRKLDTLRLLLMILWETKSLDNKKYIALSLQLDEIGRMLGGWNGQLTKQNSLA